MKKFPTILILSAICIAFLFAQEAMDASQPSLPSAPVPAGTIQSNAVNMIEVPDVAGVVPEVMKQSPVVETGTSGVEMETPAVAEGTVTAVQEEMPALVQREPMVEQGSPAVVGEIPAAVEEVAEEETAEVDEVGIVDDLTAGATISGGLISLSLKDVELQDVVRLFSRLSNANIIIPDLTDEEGGPRRIDVNLENVEWKPALKAILDTHGLELIEKIPGSEVYSIRERPADAPEPVEIKVFKLNYATVDEVAQMVDVLVKKDGGQISTYPARNSIVAQGTAKLLNDLDRIIMAVDLPREQVFIEAKFLELSDSASEQLGIDWNVLGGYSVGINGISGTYSSQEERSETTTEYQDAAGRTFENLQAAPDTVEWVEDPNNPGFYKLYNGVDYDARPGSDPDLLRIFGMDPTTANIDATTVGKTLGATLTAQDFNLVLSALKEMNGVEIVSNPKVIVANEETASILIGQREPNIRQSTTQAENADAVTTFELDRDQPYFEYGVQLEVTPTVNTADNISVKINPTLSSKLESKIAGQNSYPVTEQKTITTTFALQSGQTAAIGGLTKTENRDVDRKVPVLGSLPLLGRFFSYSSTEKKQNETVIFVTVGLANPKNIDMETGLPEDSTLAMRYRTEAKTDRGIKAAELDILRTAEKERLQDRLATLRTAEQKRLEGVREAEQKKADKERMAEQKQLAAAQKLLKKEHAAEQKRLEKQQAEEAKKLAEKAEQPAAEDLLPEAEVE